MTTVLTASIMNGILENIEFANKRLESGWNAKNEDDRSFHLASADKILTDLHLAIRCEISRQEEVQKKMREIKNTKT